jgi:hypothetical protein
MNIYVCVCVHVCVHIRVEMQMSHTCFAFNKRGNRACSGFNLSFSERWISHLQKRPNNDAFLT